MLLRISCCTSSGATFKEISFFKETFLITWKENKIFKENKRHYLISKIFSGKLLLKELALALQPKFSFVFGDTHGKLPARTFLELEIKFQAHTPQLFYGKASSFREQQICSLQANI